MASVVKTSCFSYKYYENGKTVSMIRLRYKYPQGILLIYKNLGDCILVVYEIKTSFAKPHQIANGLSRINLPGSKDQYRCMCVLPDTSNNLLIQRAKYVVSSFEINSSSPIKTVVLERMDPLDIANYYLITNVESESADVIYDYGCKYNGETSLEKKNGDIDISLKDQIRKWYKKTTFNQFKSAIERRVKGQDNLCYVLVNVYKYLECIAKDKPIIRLNLIITGPSGCGKTETMRALKEYFGNEIPKFVVSLVDMNQITSEGFKGHDTQYLVADLENGDTEGIGIVFMDEFDKKLMPMHTAQGDNVNSEIQHQLLEIIEGYAIENSKTDKKIDSSMTMFIGMGSFDVVRDRREKQVVSSKCFGFAIDNSSKEVDHFDKITREDMLELGACSELVGRFGQIVSYGPLSNDAIDSVIDLRIKEISKAMDMKISISKKMRAFLHANANTRFGNRLILTMIQEIVLQAMAEILVKEIDASEIVITDNDKYRIVATVTNNLAV